MKSHLRTTFVVSLFVVSLLVTGIVPTHISKASAVLPKSGVALILVSSPPVLPADGGSFPSLVMEFKNLTSGLPYMPTQDIQISLTSSNPQTGKVPSSVTFPAGSLLAHANFTTTSSPGNTTLSAFASGFLPSSINMTTQKVGGIPSALEVFVSPSQIPPDEKLNAEVVVQAVDAFGNPVTLGNDTRVSLSSSNSQIGSVPSSITIAAGQSFASTLFQPTYLAGQAIITASAPGFTLGSNIMTTVGPTAGKLSVTISPSLISTDPSEYATVSVQLQDLSSDTPAIASAPVNVVLTSSNTSVANVLSPNVITIPAGSSYAVDRITAGGENGVANITAAAQGYMKSSAIVQSEKPIKGEGPSQLSVSFAPTILLPNQMKYDNSVDVQLQWVNQSSGIVYPETSKSDTIVYVRSSNNQSMFVDPMPLTIPGNSTHASTYVNSTYLPGTAFVTAQSEGLVSSTMKLVSSGLIPNALAVQFAPSSLLSGNSYSSSVVVALMDQLNNVTSEPAQAPVNTVVTLASTSPSLVQVQHFLIIPAGKTYATANLTSSFGVSGSAEVVASAASYISSNSTVKVVMPAASSLKVYASPDRLVANGQSYSSLSVQLQDGVGNPEKTDIPVIVHLSAQSEGAGTVTSTVTISPGATFGTANVTTTSKPGPIQISAFANGFTPGSANVSTILFPLIATLQISNSRLPFYAVANVTLLVTSNGKPVQGALITSQTIGVDFAEFGNLTNSTGYAVGSYKARPILGTVVLQVSVTRAGFAPSSANVTLDVYNPLPPVTKPKPDPYAALGPRILSIPLLLLVPIAGASGVSYYMIVRRNKKASKAGGESDEELYL